MCLCVRAHRDFVTVYDDNTANSVALCVRWSERESTFKIKYKCVFVSVHTETLLLSMDDDTVNIVT